MTRDTLVRRSYKTQMTNSNGNAGSFYMKLAA